MQVHGFQERLRFSEQASDAPFWNKVYRRAFPNLVSQMPAHGDTKTQRMGIDRVLLLDNGRTLYVDEKKREQVYDDILLEYKHDFYSSEKETPGWMEKDLSIDFLAYAFMPTKQVYLLPWPTLRRAWAKNKSVWRTKYRNVPARNVSYTTWSVAVPIKTLMRAVQVAMFIQLPHTSNK